MFDMSMLEAALEYIAMKLPVFPVRLDKKPYTPHGLKDATLLQVRAKEYWQRWPAAGIGLVTDGLVVLDFDTKNGANIDVAKAALEAKVGKLPRTRTHETGGGGIHLLYRNPNGRGARNTTGLAGIKGLDLRGDGGYIIVPPSPHPSGHYYQVLDDCEITDAPEGLMKLLAQRGKPLPAAVIASGEEIIEGQRHASLVRIAGAMRRVGADEDEIAAALLAALKRCSQPPGNEITEDYVIKLAKDIARRYQPEPATDILDDTATMPAAEDEGWLDSLMMDSPTEKTEVSEIVEDTEVFQGTEKSLKNSLKSETEKEKNGDPLTSDKTYVNKGGVTDWVDDKIDKIVWGKVDQWLIYHKGERFDLDLICRQLDAKNAITRQSVAKKLAYEVQKDRLRKQDKLYSYVDRSVKVIDWIHAEPEAVFPLRWPVGRDHDGCPDDTLFGFDGISEIPEKSIIVIAGISNFGKTTFALNVLWETMDTMPCVYMSNEMTAPDFRAKATDMTWGNPITPTGEPKIEVIERFDGWADVIRPDACNIIDWINLGDNFYLIGQILSNIKQRLRKGIAVCVIQKEEGRNLGRGGGYSRDLATMYLTIDGTSAGGDYHPRLTVVKAKRIRKGSRYNPNGKTFSFGLWGGVGISNIRPATICGMCAGNGLCHGSVCKSCDGKGYREA